MPPEKEAQPDIGEAYRQYERQERLHTGKIAATLVIFLMPLGTLLDFFVYNDDHLRFLAVRLICALLASVILGLHFLPGLASRFRLLGLPIPLLPAAAIAWMIYVTEGHQSPYYAGLNLILLAVSVVVHWNVAESLLSVLLVIGMYVLACNLHGPISEPGIFVNNIYFLGLTGVIVVTGNFIFSRLQFREFALRYELDHKRRELQESNQKLIELDRVKSRFFANISHELRTPLTLLLGPLERLLHRSPLAISGEGRSLLITMQSNGMRLLKLINDLLDLVRLESGRMEVKHQIVFLPDFLKGLVSAVKQMAEEKNIHLTAVVQPDLHHVVTDRDKLEKILLNLVFNALKFTPEGGTVDIAARQEGAWLVLEVEDTGIGISPRQLPFIFDRFWQADGSANRKFQGTGIGLSLVKELVEVQHGTVTARSEEGKGTRFTVQLPYAQASQPDPRQEQLALPPLPEPAAASISFHEDSSAIQSEEWLANLYRRAELFPAFSTPNRLAPPVSGDAPERPRVLIADDEPDMLRFLSSELCREFQVIEAENGREALEMTEQLLPEMILLDMMMPEKNGVQVCQELRQNPATRNLSILMLTARADEETKLAALNAGANDFLAKPFSTVELRARVQNLVALTQSQRRLLRQNQRLEQTIEQLKETEMQLIQKEKLASLGRMSAGMIHEINNPLNYASTGLYTLRNHRKRTGAEGEEAYDEVLKDVDAGLQRIKKIVSDLRTFTHPNTDLVEEVGVSSIIQSALLFLSSEWKEKIQIKVDVPSQMAIQGNRNKLLQVILNLLQNALDALKAKTFESGVPTIWIEGSSYENVLRLRIRDNGEGIQPKDMSKIFDPFFTTKEIGQGMGLGLSICYRLVQEYKGTIQVRSEPGQFTEFLLEFPRPPGPTPEPASPQP